jgi:hypothetical protein
MCSARSSATALLRGAAGRGGAGAGGRAAGGRRARTRAPRAARARAPADLAAATQGRGGAHGPPRRTRRTEAPQLSPPHPGRGGAPRGSPRARRARGARAPALASRLRQAARRRRRGVVKADGAAPAGRGRHQAVEESRHVPPAVPRARPGAFLSKLELYPASQAQDPAWHRCCARQALGDQPASIFGGGQWGSGGRVRLVGRARATMGGGGGRGAAWGFSAAGARPPAAASSAPASDPRRHRAASLPHAPRACATRPCA